MEPTKRGPGRPKNGKLLTVELIEAIALGIRQGLTHKGAALNAGISVSSYYNWMQRGREAQRGLYSDLVEAVERAEEFAKSYHLAMIREIARGGKPITKTTTKVDADGNVVGIITVTETAPPSLQASIWILERRWPQEFGPKQEVAVINSDNPFEISLFGQTLVGSGNDDVVKVHDGVEE